MAWRALVGLAVVLSLALGGCLRNRYDLCDREDPHPECDAGRDSGASDGGPGDAGEPLDGDLDAGPGYAGEPDAGPSDEPSDAGAPEDSGFDGAPPEEPDAAAPPDAGEADADSPDAA
jgi:hypothetical protein